MMEIKITLPDSLSGLINQQSDPDYFIKQAIEEKLGRESSLKQVASMHTIMLSQGFMISQAIFAMINLELDKLLADGPKTSENLAQATGCHELTLRRFLRALCAVGVFKYLGGNKFGQTPISEHFDILRNCFSMEPSYQAWRHTMYTLKTGKSAWHKEHGKDFYEYLQSSPQEQQAFSTWNTKSIDDWLLPLVSSYDFSIFDTLVAVGGGEGNCLASVVKANPKLKGILFDQPQVVKNAHTIIKAAGVEDRCEVIGGNFFESVPSGGDVYVLSRVLLNWNEEQSIQILKTCHKAMAGRGKFLVIDFMIPQPDHPSYQTLVFNDLNLLIAMGGANRTEDEWRKLIELASFTVTKAIPAPPPSLLSIIEATPN